MRLENKRVVFATSAASFLGMYDFIVYAYLAKVIGAEFFPSQHAWSSILAVFMAFAVGYLARPIGGLLFGHLTDRSGRKAGLLWSICLMIIPALGIAFLPDYHTWGAFAPILFIMLRILQGLSIGGELPSAAVFLAEYAPEKQRGLFTSWLFVGVNFGTVVGALVAAVALHCLPDKQLYSWGWRVPFLLGVLLALVALYIRRNVKESPLFILAQEQFLEDTLPMLMAFREAGWKLLRGFGLVALMAGSIGTLAIFMPTYLNYLEHGSYHLVRNMPDSLWLVTVSLICFAMVIPVFGWLSDLIGRRWVMGSGAVLTIILAPLSFHLMATLQIGAIWSGLLILSILLATQVGPIAATLTETYRLRYRATGFALVYNLSFTVFCGFAPILLAYLGHYVHSVIYPSFYLILVAVITLISVLYSPETKGTELEII